MAISQQCTNKEDQFYAPAVDLLSAAVNKSETEIEDFYENLFIKPPVTLQALKKELNRITQLHDQTLVLID